MVIEQHPAIQALSPEDKLQLSEELCMDVMMDAKNRPELARLVKDRLQEFQDEPDSGIRWEDLKARLLKR